ncbi:hypothetical protein [Microbacterium karelineae]|uniref:hypothetical protein n=1 Tax=Microbacterium karelineae TaxID=2654283 RepID=UPI0012EA9513|nr:hypothetical protein [Microbacterium karelineae]
MALTGIAGEVTEAMVGVLLKERPVDILEYEYGDPPTSIFEATVQQIAAEVIPVTGPDPQGSTRALAIQCIAYGVASNIEYAEFPEQQGAGDLGRGYFLKRKFDDLLSRLASLSKDGSAGGSVSRARFPAPRPYPDPFRC